jgi:hypothetical protein
MRILLTETRAGDSATIERIARYRGVEIARCQPTIGHVTPCISLCRGVACPLDDHVDAVIDVHADGTDALSTRELGVVCAMRAGLPIVVVGDNPLDGAATQSSQDAAVDEAMRLVRLAADRPTTQEISRRVTAALLDAGSGHHVNWVGYVDWPGGFDVIIELSHALTTDARDRLDVALMPMFWRAIEDGRFGRLIYEARSPRLLGA